MTVRERQISGLAAAWHEAELELQLLCRIEPAEAYERAEAARTAYLRAVSPVPSPFVTMPVFSLRLAVLLGVVGMVATRLFLHR